MKANLFKLLLTLIVLMLSLSINAQDGKINGHEYVDLGLPSGTLWATTNVGGSSDVGTRFSWGESEINIGINEHRAGWLDGNKTTFTLNTYKYYKKTTTKDSDGFDVTVKGYTKYVSNPSLGYDSFCDNKITLDPSDDAATVNWGNDWSIPSIEDWTELIQFCKWESKSLNNKEGYKVTGTNGKFIFLPFTGYVDNNLYYSKSYLAYWANTVSSTGYGACLYKYSITELERYKGLCVRAVSHTTIEDKVPTDTCSIPIISINNGKIQFACKTEGAGFHYTIKKAGVDLESYSEDGLVDINTDNTYTITCYATADGYIQSPTVTETITIDKADVNEDGTVDISDVNAVISTICGN